MARLPVLRTQYFDTNGEPYREAQLFFYERNSTTPLDTFTDRTLGTAHDNPVEADSDGWFPDIHVTPNVGYKVVLKDSTNNQIWVVDDMFADTGGSGGGTGYVSPTDFGAIGDGAADEAAEVQQAIDSTDNIVDLGGLIFRCDSQLTVPSGVTIQNGTLDFSNCPDNEYVIAEGTLGSGVALTADCDADDVAFDAASVAGLSVGDWVMLRAPLATYTGGGEVIGEVARVNDITSLTVGIDAQAERAYNVADEAQYRLITYVDDVAILNVNFVCDLAPSGDGNVIMFDKVYRGRVEGCTFTDNAGAAVTFRLSNTCSATNNKVFNSTVGSSGGIGYVLDDCTRDVTISGGSVENCSWGVRTGVSVNVGGAVRNAVVSDVFFEQCLIGVKVERATESIDVNNCVFSSTSDYSSSGIRSNACISAVNNRFINIDSTGSVSPLSVVKSSTGLGSEIFVVGNFIKNCTSLTSAIGVSGANETNVTISNNIIDLSGLSDETPSINVIAAIKAVIANNTITSTTSTSTSNIGIYTTTPVRYVTITGNNIEMSGGRGVVVEDSIDVNISGNNIRTSGATYGIDVDGGAGITERLAITGNTVENATGAGCINVDTTTAASKAVIVSGNACTGDGTTPVVNISPVKVTLLAVTGNTIYNTATGTTARGVKATGVAGTDIAAATFCGNAFYGGNYGIEIANTGDTIHDGNVFIAQGTAETTGTFDTTGDFA